MKTEVITILLVILYIIYLYIMIDFFRFYKTDLQYNKPKTQATDIV